MLENEGGHENEGDIDPGELEEIPRRGSRIDADAILVPIEKLMRKELATVSPADSVAAAIKLMVEQHVGCVLVVDGGTLRGILSERDVMTRIAHPGLDPSTERVLTHMTRNPETLRPEDAVAYALNIMSVGGFRHVPITDGAGRVAGIVSIRDIQRLLTDAFRTEVLTLPPRPVRSGPGTRHGG